MSKHEYNTFQFEFLNQLPKELIAKVFDYLTTPKTIFKVEQIDIYENNIQLEGVVLNLVICTRTQIFDSYTHSQEYICNQTTIKHNINFMNIESDIEKIESFLDCLNSEQSGSLSWDSPRYSPTQLNVITYLNEPDTQPKLICEIYQLTHEQYYPPSPALVYNVDSAFGKFKSASHSITITQREIEQFIRKIIEIKQLVQRYG